MLNPQLPAFTFKRERYLVFFLNPQHIQRKENFDKYMIEHFALNVEKNSIIANVTFCCWYAGHIVTRFDGHFLSTFPTPMHSNPCTILHFGARKGIFTTNISIQIFIEIVFGMQLVRWSSCMLLLYNQVASRSLLR